MAGCPEDLIAAIMGTESVHLAFDLLKGVDCVHLCSAPFFGKDDDHLLRVYLLFQKSLSLALWALGSSPVAWQVTWPARRCLQEGSTIF